MSPFVWNVLYRQNLRSRKWTNGCLEPGVWGKQGCGLFSLASLGCFQDSFTSQLTSLLDAKSDMSNVRGGIPGPLLSNKHTNLIAICDRFSLWELWNQLKVSFTPGGWKIRLTKSGKEIQVLLVLELWQVCHSLAVWGKTEAVSWASYIIDSP